MGTQLRDNSQDVGYKYLYELDIQTWALISNVNYKKNFSSLISGISKLFHFEDSMFIHSCSKLEGDICYFPFANINFKTHATNLPYLLGHSVVSRNSRQRSSEARANIGTCVFSHNPYVCTRIFEKKECFRSLAF